MVRISRRRFLKGAAAATAGVLVTGQMEYLPTFAADSIFQYNNKFSVSVVRPDDFLALRFDFVNLTLSQANKSGVGAANLVPIASPAYIVVNLPPQNIAEQAFFETGDSTQGEGKPDPNSAVPTTGPCAGLTGSALTTCVAANNSTTLPGGESHSSLTGETPTAPGTVKSKLSGWSRLVFLVPPNVTSIPYTLPGLLQAIATYDLSVPLTALPPSTTPPKSTPPLPYDPTGSNETYIEAPYRLLLSPNNLARWAHSPTPVSHGVGASSRTELWHTRLAVALNGMPDEVNQPPKQPVNNLAVRAVWSPDFEIDPSNSPYAKPVPTNPNLAGDLVTHYSSSATLGNSNGPPGFRISVDNRDRDEIVHLTSNFHMQYFGAGPPISYVPPAVPVSRLILSSLGAWIDLDGRWDPPLPGPLSVTEWRHKATMARDHYVKVVYAGWLAPFGHRASLIKETERKFFIFPLPGTFAPENIIVAYLRQRMYIVVREPEKTYPAPGQPWNGRRTPFQKLQITTLVTPPLIDPTNSQADSQVNNHGQDAFWPQIPVANPSPPNFKAQDFLFHFIATDWDGNTSDFSAPLIFVDTSLSDTDLQSILTDSGTSNGYLWNGSTPPSNLGRRTVQMNGQKIAFAPSENNSSNMNSGKARYETSAITWTVEIFNTPQGTSLYSHNELPGDEPTTTAPTLKGEYLPIFFPAVEYAPVRIASIQELSGGSPSSPGTSNPTTPAISFHGGMDPSNNPFGYLWNGFKNANSISPDPNLGEVFAKLHSFDPNTNNLLDGIRVDLSQNVEKLGGILTPSLNYAGLARQAGAIPGDISNIESSLTDLANGNGFDPTTALLDDALSQAKILGGIQLTKLFGKITNLTNLDYGDGIRVPKIVAKVEYDQSKTPPIPKDIKITLHWEPTMVSWDPFIDLGSGTGVGVPPSSSVSAKSPLLDCQNYPPYMNQGKEDLTSTAPIVIDANLTKSFDPNQEPTYNVTGIINGPIVLNLMPGGNSDPLFVIGIPFNKLKFTLETGGKTDVSCDLGKLSFHGILSFVQTLENILSGLGLDDPPYLDVNASGITAGLNIGVPTIPIGALIISDIALDLSLNVPFIGDPARLRFSISTREQPFTITYTIFGGGGFFGVALGLDGFEMFEASLEFGAFLSLDLGVASGSAHADVGIYFKLSQIAPNSNTHPSSPPPSMIDDTEITGFCSIGGELEVLGIITVSTEFYMSISYDSATNTCEGQAELTVEVDVLMFHASVTLGPIEKKFTTDPSAEALPFGYLVPQPAWTDYMDAFA